MKKLAFIATIFILLVLLLFGVNRVSAQPILILNPGFETPDTAPSIANWTFSEVGDNDYDGAQATEPPDWVTQGTYSYKISIPAKNITGGAHAQILQSVNFNPIDTFSFDAYLQADTALEFEALVLVGTNTVWGPQAVPTVATEYLHQEVDVSGITTTEDLIFRIVDLTAAKSATISCYFDNIKTWGSYGESGRTTVANNFATYGDSVYMYGENFDINGTYKVAYYDGGTSGDGSNGAKLLTETYTDDGDGVLDLSQVRPADFMSSASAGTWHAVVYKTTESMPLTYDLVSTTSANYTVTDSFNVASTAIPEFPTVIAAIAVAGLCFGIYYWMRRRY